MHKLTAVPTLKVGHHPRNLFHESGTRNPSLALLTKSIPKSHADNLRLGPLLVDILNKRRVCLDICFAGDIVVRVRIVSTNVDDDDIRVPLLAEIPLLGLESVQLLLTPVSILRLAPLEHLAAGIAPAESVCGTDTGICSDAKLCVAKASTDLVCPAGNGFVRSILSGGKGVANDFNVTREILELVQLRRLVDVHSSKLDALAPVCNPELESLRLLQVRLSSMRTLVNEKVRSIGADVCERPVETTDTIRNQCTRACMFAKGNSNLVACKAKLKTRTGPPTDELGVPAALVRKLLGIGLVRLPFTRGVLEKVDGVIGYDFNGWSQLGVIPDAGKCRRRKSNNREDRRNLHFGGGEEDSDVQRGTIYRYSMALN